MHVFESELIYSATDLSNFLACAHLTLLDRAVALGAPKPPKFDDPSLEVLRRRGFEHEQAILERFDVDVATIKEGSNAVADTFAAMRSGVPVIYQGALRSGGWFGRPDFLIRLDRPSRLGNHSYEVIDAKLARHAKGGALLQLLVYADLLEATQGILPEHAYLELGVPEARLQSFRVSDYIAYFRLLKRRFEEHVRAAPDQLPRAPDPTEHCMLCSWQMQCDSERREVDHLSLVAGIRRSQRRALDACGVDTVERLADLDLQGGPPVDGLHRTTLEKIRDQARIQVEGRRAGEPRYELLEPVVPNEGLGALPSPSAGDLFFDIEADPYALTHGIEYLFGLTDATGQYTARWALDRTDEREAFEEFIDGVMERLERYPDLHIYHFGSYETAAVKRLMGRHATREDEVDRLLRGKVFVDLHRVVRQSLRASVESYSIKKLEPFYSFRRTVELRSANSALAHFEAWLELGGDDERRDELLDCIENYNRDDCLSTLRLRDWLEQLRDELAAHIGAEVPRPDPGDPEPGKDLSDHLEEVAELTELLTVGTPDDPEHRTVEQQARWILAQLLGFHRRENKSTWWQYFEWLAMSDDELIEDSKALGGLTYEGVVGSEKRSLIHRYRFPRQDHGLRPEKKIRDPETEGSPGTIVAIDDGAGTIDLKRGQTNPAPHPRAIIPYEYVGDGVLRDTLLRIARAVVEDGLGDAARYRAASDLLMRHPPRTGRADGEQLILPGESPLEAACRLVLSLDRTILPIQGPPGSGKTFTGARMIVAALKAGKRVGVTGPSHSVIAQLLDKICEAAREEGYSVSGIQKAEQSQLCTAGEIKRAGQNEDVLEALQRGEATLAGGTAWLWSREEMIGAVDLLFIDEAGQFSLANALGVAPAADSLVLLGDPKQLDEPLQGVHPPGTDVSALAHLLGDAPTMPPEQGLFLDRTFRLHPDICRFTSELFYDGRLHPRDGLEAQCIRGHGPLSGAGLRFVPVHHEGNVSESPEEVEVVADIIGRLLDGGAMWTNSEGVTSPLTIRDILVVAPYNAHVAALQAGLPKGARVGTVDKFQGQEAPIVIYSIATSSAEDAPRGMGFLFSLNRLNVATSRAQALVVVVANPDLFEPECRTPEQMKLANAFCRYQELATTVPHVWID